MGSTNLVVLNMPHVEMKRVPTVLLKKGVVRFNHETLKLLQYPEYIQCLLSEDQTMFGIRKCSRTDKGAIACCQSGIERMAFQVTSADILKIVEDNSWGVNSMKLNGYQTPTGEMEYPLASAFLVSPRKKKKSMEKEKPSFSTLTYGFESVGKAAGATG